MGIEIGKREWGLGAFAMFILVLVVHIIDIKLRLQGDSFPIIHIPMLILYAILAVMATILLSGDESSIADKILGIKTGDSWIGKLQKYAFVSLIAYCLPLFNLIASLFDQIPGISLQMIISTIILFCPIWIIYLFAHEDTILIKVCAGVYLIIWASALIGSIPALQLYDITNVEIPGIMPGMTMGIALNKAVSGAQNAYSIVKTASLTTTQEVKDAITIAKTGIDPTQARIQETREQATGATLTSIQLPSKNIYTDEPLTVYSQLKISPFENPIHATIKCEASSKTQIGKIYPKNEFEIETTSIQDLDCVFTKEQIQKLGAGIHTVKMSAIFNFETISYLETFFMTQERLRQMQKKGEDPLAGYPQPEAICSQGPVNINIKTPEAPIASEQDKKITTAITIFNNGGGTIKEIDSLYIYIPKGFSLFEEIETSQVYKEIKCSDLPEQENKMCDPETTTVYKVIGLDKLQYQDIRTAREFRIYLQMEDYDKIIGEAPIKPGSFHASMKYQYELEKKTTINIQEPGMVI